MEVDVVILELWFVFPWNFNNISSSDADDELVRVSSIMCAVDVGSLFRDANNDCRSKMSFKFCPSFVRVLEL